MRTSPWPAPTGSPVGTWGWYRASDGRWYRTDTSPAPGWALGPDGRWEKSLGEAWRTSRWGLGDAWWGLLAYVAASLLLGLALIASVAVTGGDIDDLEPGPYALSVLVIGNVAAFLGIPWLATRRKGLRSLRDDFGLWWRPVDLAIGLGFGIVGLVGAAIAGGLVDAAFGADEATSNIPVDSLGEPAEIIAFAIAVALVTPLIEELFFRGLIYRSLLKRGGSTVAAIGWTTFVFVVPHLTAADSLASAVSLTASIAVLGLSFQLACHVTQRRLGAPIVAHVVVNGAAVLALALG
ncbi:MAG TPA: CPBP family intramembrane glutamic endopeptidase [Ilumatobacter sp.]|nr:CPBP family intramembrane glutamic endopeptidase [Ilumatobacter sp.]